MRIVVTGSSGLIGTALVTQLHSAGHDVVRLVRRPARRADEVTWDPARGVVDLAGLAGVQAAVHLAGAGVGDHRWTEDYKRTIRDSRVLSTRTLVNALTQLDPLPSVLVAGSAEGFYGDRGEEVLTEESPGGRGFLADVVRAWEAETAPAAEAGIRVAVARTGLVLASTGPAFGPLIRLAKLGIGGRLGSGRQWWSWISMDDELAALQHLLTTADAQGPFNLAAPEPARNADVIRAIGRAVHRPTLVPVPGFALRIVIGEFAGEVLGSIRISSERLEKSGFRFGQPTLDAAVDWLAPQV